MIEHKNVRPVEVLLVEDNEDDIDLTKEAFSEARIKLNLHIARDGIEALKFLRDSENPTPDLILLDLNMPRKDGRETLADLKADPRLKRIPVIIITTSEADADVLSAYNQNANSYIVKPVDFDQFLKVMRTLEEFWFTIVKLPPGQNE